MLVCIRYTIAKGIPLIKHIRWRDVKQIYFLSHQLPVIWSLHTAGSDTIFVQIYMDALPGVPGVSKNSQKYATNKSVEFLR